MERDERLLPLPNASDLHLAQQDTASSYAPFYDDENAAEGRSIREYFLVIYKRLPLILALTIIATAVTAFYMYRLPSIYEAQTTMIIEPRKPKVQQKETTIINFGNDLNYYNTQLRLLQNPELMREVVIRLELYRNPNLFSNQNKGVVASVRSMLSGNKNAENNDSSLPVISEPSVENDVAKMSAALTPEEKVRVDAYSGMLAGGLTVEQVPSTQLVNIKLTTTDPNLAPKVVDMVATVFIQNDFKRETKTGVTTYDDLSKSINTLKDTIAQQEQERIGKMRSTGLPLQSEGEKVAAARLQQMSSQWLEAENSRRQVQAKYEAAVAASKRGEIFAVMGEDRTLQDAQVEAIKRKADLEKRIEKIDSDINEAETAKSALLVKYQPASKQVQTVDETIKTLSDQKNKLQNEIETKIKAGEAQLYRNAESKVLVGLQAQLSAAQRSEGQAYNLYLKELGSANQQGQAAAELTNLSAYIETNRSLLNTYIQRQKEMELTMNSERPDNITVSTLAQEASLVGPNRNRNIVLAFLVSLAAGIGLAFLFDYLDDSIKTSDDIGRNLGLPTLALIPHYNVGKKGKTTSITTKNGSLASAALISLEDTRSAIAEAYRHLRTSLLFSSAGKPPQTILVTSSQPSEGKTTTAINTAITLAQSGADVVIIDCDLRRPRLHSHFDMENSTGLTNYLSGDRNTEILLKPYPGLPNLKVITSGPIPPNPAELLSSGEMKHLLQFLKGNFKHVVIDSPPAISFTDAAILATLVDGVVLVAMAGKSSIHLMRRFKQRLSTMGARIYGVVLNGIKPNTLEYGYYGYGYTYSYYEASDDDTTPRMEDEVTVETMKK